MSDEDASFYVTGMYGMKTKQSLVSIKLKDIVVQVTPTKAREMATMLMQAAESAESDGFVLEFMADLAGGDVDREKMAASVLERFRAFRLRADAWHRGHEKALQAIRDESNARSEEES